jgi:serpin B
MRNHANPAALGEDLKADLARVVDKTNHFALDLYAKLNEPAGNLFFSPSSITLALAMTVAGARGETARQMAEAVRFALPPDQLHEAFRELQASTRTGSVDLRIANRLWGQRGYHFLPEFMEITEWCYGAKLADVDFRAAPEQAREEINRWIEQQTANKITNLISPGVLNEMTRLVLANAVYFLGAWESEFKEANTKTAPFWTTPSEQSPVSMMSQTGHFMFGEFDDLQVLELPYRSRAYEMRHVKTKYYEGEQPVEIPGGGSDFSMCILLPRKIDGIKDIEARLSPATLQQWMKLRACRVEVQVPKFRVESAFSLSDALTSLGMKKAFVLGEADFSGMSDDPEGLFIGAVLHKAFVDVNEKGTEAAAATFVGMIGGSSMRPEPPKVFRADHPFLFLIRDRETQLIHFIGRVVNPT